MMKSRSLSIVLLVIVLILAFDIVPCKSSNIVEGEHVRVEGELRFEYESPSKYEDFKGPRKCVLQFFLKDGAKVKGSAKMQRVDPFSYGCLLVTGEMTFSGSLEKALNKEEEEALAEYQKTAKDEQVDRSKNRWGWFKDCKVTITETRTLARKTDQCVAAASQLGVKLGVPESHEVKCEGEILNDGTVRAYIWDRGDLWPYTLVKKVAVIEKSDVTKTEEGFLRFLGVDESGPMDFSWNFAQRLPFGATVVAGGFKDGFPHIYLTLSGPLANAYNSSSGVQSPLRFESDEGYEPLGEWPASMTNEDYYGEAPSGERYVPVDLRKGISLKDPQDKVNWPSKDDDKWISHSLDYEKLWDIFWGTVKLGVSKIDDLSKNLGDLRGSLKAVAYRVDKSGETNEPPELTVLKEVQKEIKLTHVAEITEAHPGYAKLVGKLEKSKGIRVYSKRKNDKKYDEFIQAYRLDNNLKPHSSWGISPTKKGSLAEPLELLPGDVVRLGKYDSVRIRMLFDDPHIEWYVKGRSDILGPKEMGQIVVFPRGGEPTVEWLKKWGRSRPALMVMNAGLGWAFGFQFLTKKLGWAAGPVGGIIGFLIGEAVIYGTTPTPIEWKKVKWVRIKDLQSIMAGDVGYREARIYAISGKATFEDLDGKERTIKAGQLLKVGGPYHFMVETYDEKSLPSHIKSVVQEYREVREGGESLELSATPPAEPEKPSPQVSPPAAKPGRDVVPTVPWHQGEVVQQYDNGTINWSKGTITAVGIGAPPANAINMAQARAMARRAAIVIARRNLLELAQGVQIDSMTLVKEAVVQSDIIRTSIQGVVRNAQIVGTDYMSDGSVEIKVAMNMSGQFANTILPQHSPAVPWATGPAVATTTPETLKPSSDIITGLVVDARGLGTRPAMSPKIVDETGKEIYGSAEVNRQYAVQQGMAGYSRDLIAAQGNSRVTANPLTVKGLRSVGPGKSDIVISNSDASRIMGAAENLLFMQKCRVMIVVD